MFNEIKNFFEKIKYENGGFPIGVKILAAVLAVMILHKIGFNLIYRPYIFIHIILLIFSLLMHELGHGYMAKLCGDNTASYYGSRIIASMGDDSLRYKVFEYDKYGFLLIMFLAWSGLLERMINIMTDGVYFLINLIIF